MTSPIGWPGGKRALLKTLLSLIPRHNVYCEAFAGSAKLLFSKPAAPIEVLNDASGDLINFFRVAKHRPAELAERLELECIHAARFRDLKSHAPADELERALRFLYLNWYSFGSKGEHFAMCNPTRKPKHPLDQVRTALQETARRLARVQIEQRDFAEMLARYDDAKTFFYLDPPYTQFQGNGRYTPMTAERREELFARLCALKGKFLMSFDDCAEIRRLARKFSFRLRSVSVVYTINGSANRRPSREVLIANYPLHALAVAA